MVRPAEDRDLDAAAAILAEHTPWLWTAGGIRHRNASLPERARRATWVGEWDGRVAGWVEAEFDWTAEREDIGTVYAIVAPEHRGRGLGSTLYESGVAHLLDHGATELRTWSQGDGDAFVERRGFVRAREERVSSLDPRTVDTSPLDSLPRDVRVVPLADLLDRLADVHAVYAEATRDVPSDHPETRIPLDEWLAETVANPELSVPGSFVVLVDDRPAALSWLTVDEERRYAEQELTGTSRAYRRRGLARLAKLAVIRWAAANAYGRLITGNDDTNVAMLALNDTLGFRPFAVETEWVKQVT